MLEKEIKGLPGVGSLKIDSGGPFYILRELTGVGCVITLSDDKQERPRYL